MQGRGGTTNVQNGWTGKNVYLNIIVREFEPADEAEVQRIFCEGMMEMVADTAFRGLRHHPESLLLYTAITVACCILTACWWLIGLLPALFLCGRYFYSTHVVCAHMEHVMSTDMGDIQGFYMNSSDSRLWVAELQGKVVGVVAAVGLKKSGGAVELKRMSVDRRFRRFGVGVALGRKVLEFAVTQRSSAVILGTTAYTPAAHQLYQRLGFRRVMVTNGFAAPGAGRSVLETLFYRVHHYHYHADV